MGEAVKRPYRWELIIDEVTCLDIISKFVAQRVAGGWECLDQGEGWAILRDSSGVDWYIHSGLDGDKVLMQAGRVSEAQ